MKKLTALLLGLLLSAGLLAGCAEDSAAETEPTTPATQATKPIIPAVRCLIFQPELEESWQNLAAAYTAETGVPVTVTAEKPDSWRQALDGYLEEEDAPTLYQLISPIADDRWEELCYDLSDTDAAEELISTDYALTREEAILALPGSVKASGLWVNKALLAKAGFAPEDITSLDALKTVCDAIAAAENPGFAAFTLPTQEASSRQLDLAGAAIAWEFTQEGLTDPRNFRGTALNSLRTLLDLALGSSTGPERTPEASLQEFLEGKAAFCFGSTHDYAVLSSAFSDDELALLPLFLREEVDEEDADEAEDSDETEPTEETQPPEEEPAGLCIGVESYWCVNPDAPEQDLSVTLDFLNWCLGTEEGAAALAEIGYDLPYFTAPEAANPFLPELDDGDLLHRRDWAIPSQQWKTAFCEALTAYTADPTDEKWEDVSRVFARYWAAEYALAFPAE